jgi:hypothetical protein
MRRISVKWGKVKVHLPVELVLILLLLASLLLHFIKW